MLKRKFLAKKIVGYDEAGRGAICGPLVAACCLVEDDYYNESIDDSKLLSERKREQLSEEIRANTRYKIVEYSNEQIDELGIQTINKMAFTDLRDLIDEPNALHIVDGNIMEHDAWCHSFVKGDRKSFAIACASILAKHHRDSYMREIAPLYENYNLEHNKGYGMDYLDRVAKFGKPEPIHRQSFGGKTERNLKLF